MRCHVAIGLVIFLAAAFAYSGPGFAVEDAAANVDVYVTAQPPVFPFHKQTHFTVTVEAPADIAVEIPGLAKEFGALSVTGPPAYAAEKLKDGRIRTSRTYTLEAIFAGDYPIKPITVKVANTETKTVPSPTIRVRDLTPDETAAAEHFEPNAPPRAPKLELLRDWRFWTLVAGASVAAAGAGAYWLLKRRKAKPAAPPAPPWEVAYARLRELDARQLPHKGQFGPYYVLLSDILRHYIEDRFMLHAPERTTPEFLAEARGSGALSKDHQELLARFLLHCDHVKFARYEPSIGEMDNSLASVLRFVDETVPAPEPAKEKAA